MRSFSSFRRNCVLKREYLLSLSELFKKLVGYIVSKIAKTYREPNLSFKELEGSELKQLKRQVIVGSSRRKLLV